MSVVAIADANEFFIFGNKVGFRSVAYHDESYGYTTVEFDNDIVVLSTENVEEEVNWVGYGINVVYTDVITVDQNGTKRLIDDDAYQRGDGSCTLTKLSQNAYIVVNDGDVSSCLVFCNGTVIVRHKKEPEHTSCEIDSCVFCDTNPNSTTFDEINDHLMNNLPLETSVVYVL